jgi:hypothetical protein|tara:strand:+ start:70315 stop:70518 length:204 start_codon:yes stop_codon:yes gene_type:complete
MTKFLNKNILVLIGGVLGAIGGYSYYSFIGCNSGTCSITSSPINSTVYGIVLGGLFFSLFQKEKKQK